jgi:hypothetical protein
MGLLDRFRGLRGFFVRSWIIHTTSFRPNNGMVALPCGNMLWKSLHDFIRRNAARCSGGSRRRRAIRGCFRWWGSSYRSTLNSSKARLPPIPGAIPSRTRAGVAGRGFAQKSGSLLWVTGKSRLPEFLCIRLASSRTWQTPAPVPYRPSALIPRLERWRPFQVLRLQREATLFQWRWTLRANLPTWQTSPATTFRRTASLPTERRRPSG